MIFNEEIKKCRLGLSISIGITLGIMGFYVFLGDYFTALTCPFGLLIGLGTIKTIMEEIE